MWYFALLIATTLMQTSPASEASSRLGPIRVVAPSIDEQGWIHYNVRSDLSPDVGLTFWSFEIHRIYADGTHIVTVQEQDFLESEVLSCVSISSLPSPG
jgi:hypothetical protein